MFAPAKVNLFLHVTGKREDGYHLLDSLVVFAEIGDVVKVEPAAQFSLRLDGPFGQSLSAGADNLVARAARDLAAAAGIASRAAVKLTKNLPVASGIGGGSADAAASLLALSRLWNLDLALTGIALRLGADVPVCLASRPARMGGIGEVLSAAPGLPALGLLLVNPGVAVSTAEVFRALQGAVSQPAVLPAGWASAAAMAADLRRTGNDLQAAACAMRPAIGDVLAALDELPGCLLARMSGSGATCFGLFETPAEASAAAVTIARPGWWAQGGGLYDPARRDL